MTNISGLYKVVLTSPEISVRDSQFFTEMGNHQGPLLRISRLHDQGLQLTNDLVLARQGQTVFADKGIISKFGQRTGTLHQRSNSLRTLGAHKGVGIMACGQESDSTPHLLSQKKRDTPVSYTHLRAHEPDS